MLLTNKNERTINIDNKDEFQNDYFEEIVEK